MAEVSELPDADVLMQHLQRRVVRLLLRHHEHLFRRQFHYFFEKSALSQIPLLRRYDRFLKLQTLSDELLDDILPRIHNELSLKTSHARLREEAPTRGEIDWQRTIERSWSIAPGMPAMQFETRQRQHTTDTPENLLIVAILLAFRHEVQQTTREGLEDEALDSEEKQVFTAIAGRIERVLAMPYARALLEQAHKADIPELAQRIAAHLHSRASSYHDLLTWWQRFIRFRVGRAKGEQTLSLVGKGDGQQNNVWLYELWVMLECIHLLYTEGCIQPADIVIEHGLLRCNFTWQQRRFHLLSRHQPATASNVEVGQELWLLAGLHYTIERETPLEIAHQGEIIWREPPVILKVRGDISDNNPAGPSDLIKELLGEMTLLEVGAGVLLSPCLPELTTEEHTAEVIKIIGRQRYAQERTRQIHLTHLEPMTPWQNLQVRLRSMLDFAAQNLPERSAPACQGYFIDTDSMNVSRSIPPAQTILYPKPHIGSDVFDLVNLETDCLKNPKVCHVIGQWVAPPSLSRAMTQGQLVAHSSTLRQRSDAPLDQAEKEGDGRGPKNSASMSLQASVTR